MHMQYYSQSMLIARVISNRSNNNLFSSLLFHKLTVARNDNASENVN